MSMTSFWDTEPATEAPAHLSVDPDLVHKIWGPASAPPSAVRSIRGTLHSVSDESNKADGGDGFLWFKGSPRRYLRTDTVTLEGKGRKVKPNEANGRVAPAGGRFVLPDSFVATGRKPRWRRRLATLGISMLLAGALAIAVVLLPAAR